MAVTLGTHGGSASSKLDPATPSLLSLILCSFCQTLCLGIVLQAWVVRGLVWQGFLGSFCQIALSRVRSDRAGSQVRLAGAGCSWVRSAKSLGFVLRVTGRIHKTALIRWVRLAKPRLGFVLPSWV